MTMTAPGNTRAVPGLGSLPRLFAPPSPDFDAHRATFGPVPTRAHLTADLDASGLTGRGGAGFPTARKLAAMGPGGSVIANGSEGEPMSDKDATLLEVAPHLVIDGLLATAAAVGARRTAIVVKEKHEELVRRALDERKDARRIEVHIAPDRFIAGEASAVVNLVGRGEAVPTDRTVRLTESGLRRRPTLVQNIETLAHVALIARYGSAWFGTVGTADAPGSRLLSLCGDVPQPTVIEAAGGITIAEALEAVGADPARMRAVLVGGYHGAWVDRSHFGTALSDAALRPYGAAVGAGVLMALADGRCGLRATAVITDYLAEQTAGQCGPCVNGLPALAGAVRTVATRRLGDPRTVLTLAGTVDGRGSCHHPDGTARFVRSSMQVFSDELAAHAAGWCIEARR